MAIIQPVADHAAGLLRELGLGVNVWANLSGGLTRGQKGSAEIEIPDVARTAVEEAESQLGADDWDLKYPVSIWLELTEAKTTQNRLVVLLEQWIAAVDADPTLGGLVLEAKVTDAKRQYQLADPKGRELVGYETELSVLKLVF